MSHPATKADLRAELKRQTRFMILALGLATLAGFGLDALMVLTRP